MWPVQSSWGFQGQLRVAGPAVGPGVHDILIFSLLCSLACLVEFRCAFRKHHPLNIAQSLGGGGGGGGRVHFLLCTIRCLLFNLVCWLCWCALRFPGGSSGCAFQMS